MCLRKILVLYYYKIDIKMMLSSFNQLLQISCSGGGLAEETSKILAVCSGVLAEPTPPNGANQRSKTMNQPRRNQRPMWPSPRARVKALAELATQKKGQASHSPNPGTPRRALS